MRYELINFTKRSDISKTLPTGKPRISNTRKSFIGNPLTTIPTKKIAKTGDNEQVSRDVVEAEMQWDIYYGCFFAKPRRLPPTNTPLLRRNTSKKCNGVWLSSDSRMSLQLARHSNSLVLLISAGPTIYEEHHILKLSFCWPQLSCQEQGPSRPSRVVFACYRDCSGQVQKFAMRFLTSSDSEAFVNCLKESLNSTIDFGHSYKFGSESLCPVNRNLRNGVRNRKDRDFCNENPPGNSEPSEQTQLTSEDMQDTCSEEPLLTHVSEAEDASMPSSYTDLLTSVSCTSEEKEVQETPPEFHQNSQADDCKADPSFHEMLTALEMFINELGGDLAL